MNFPDSSSVDSEQVMDEWNDVKMIYFKKMQREPRKKLGWR